MKIKPKMTLLYNIVFEKIKLKKIKYIIEVHQIFDIL